jgi:Sec-independent protein translocase protein TatA
VGRALSQVSSKVPSHASNRYRDIDDSDLPDAVKNLLRMIRDLRGKLAELARELQEVQADEGMDPAVKRARLRQIQAQMSALNGALMAATQKLSSLMRDMKLDKQQQMSAAQLALA